MPKRTGPMPALFIDGHDLSERVYSLDVQHVRTGFLWTHDRLRFTLHGQDPLPIDPHSHGPVPVRASLDERNWWEGEARVVDWDVDKLGHHVEMHGQLSSG